MPEVDNADDVCDRPLVSSARVLPTAATAPDGAVRSGRPVLPSTYVVPTRLWQALDDADGSAVTELIGPAGSGKTLGVAGWLDGRCAADRAAHGPAETASWWWTATPELTADLLRDLLDLASLPSSAGDQDVPPARIVLDNAERLSAACLGTLQRVLDESPDRVRLILLTRRGLPLRRVAPMLLGTLSVIRGDVLRMADDEVRHLVDHHAGGCSTEVADSIVDHARGWSAAAVLGARAARGLVHHPVTGRPSSDAGSVGRSASCLVGHEAFASLRSRERHVLLTVCHEELVQGSNAVQLSQDDGALEVLEGLEQMGLLLQRESGTGHAGPAEDVFRIHPILRQVTRSRLAAGDAEADRARRCVAAAARADIARGEVGVGLRRTLEGAGGTAAVDALVRHGLAAVVRGDAGAVGELVRRCAGAVEAEPRAWLAVAVERWLSGDLEAAALWSARIVSADGPAGSSQLGRADDVALADGVVAHLIRAQLGAENVSVAFEEATALAQQGAYLDTPRGALASGLRGAASCWTGDLTDAEHQFAGVVMSAGTHGFGALTADALSRLAFTELLRGRPAAAAALSAQALRCTTGRSVLALVAEDAASARLDPWRHAAVSPPAPLSPGRDLVATFVAHVTGAQRLLLQGHAAQARLALSIPPPLPQLPRHLAIDLGVRRALVAVSCDDTDTLAEVGAELRGWGAEPERCLVEAFHAICRRDLKRADACLRSAATTEESPFVAVTATATRAQVTATRGDHPAARALVAEAVDRGEHRSDALAFVGWVGHLVPLHVLLAGLSAHRAASSWSGFLARGASEHGSVAAIVSPRAVTRRESGTPPVAALTTREHEVLAQLARGATYADIAATLFVSSNTVKTHVTSLYAKLGVARRSDALATARTLRLV